MVEKPQKVNQQPKQKAPHTKKVSAFAVLFAIIGLMAALTWVIPSGKYNMIKDPSIRLRKFAKPAPTSASTKSNAP